MELSEACDKLARLMREDRFVRIREGAPIQFFCDYLREGETPAMALAMVKRFYFLQHNNEDHDQEGEQS